MTRYEKLAILFIAAGLAIMSAPIGHGAALVATLCFVLAVIFIGWSGL